MFKADRIDRVTLTDERYEMPNDFDLTEYFGPSWGVLREEGSEATEVVLRVSAAAAPWVEDERWHPSQQVRALADGGLEMRFRCTLTNELVRWVLSLGGEARVEKPAELRDLVRSEAGRVAGG